jgi:hypothetical protein
MGIKAELPAANIRYAGPAREADGVFVSKNDIELVVEGFPAKRYVRITNRQGFIDELSRVSPQAEIARF